MANLNPQVKLSEEELQEKILILQRDLESAKANNQALWLLLDEMSNRIQISLAGIKATVTSLLDYDILWDGSTKHDFLEIIENNVDTVSKKMMLFTIASKIQTDQLEIVLEPNSIGEVLSYVVDLLADEYPSCKMRVNITADGKPILVDFEYFSRALLLLLETFVEIQPEYEQCRIEVSRSDKEWFICIMGLKPAIKNVFSNLPEALSDHEGAKAQLSLFSEFRLYVIKRLLALQSIKLEAIAAEDEKDSFIRISIPTVGDI
jgi:K+-sensing histidine kinase KdpD